MMEWLPPLERDSERRALGTSAPGPDDPEMEDEAVRAERDARSVTSRFDLSEVRIHDDAESAGRAQALRAEAFTVGNDIFFSAGAYRPDLAAGRALISHELTHIAQQRRDGALRIQRAPDKSSSKAKQATNVGVNPAHDLQLPWSYGDYTQFEVRRSGVRFLVALSKTEERAARDAIPAIARRITADNSSITDAKRRVRTCFITPATTRFAYWHDEPVLILDPDAASEQTVAHEMGHAIFDALGHGGASRGKTTKSEASGAGIRARVADLFHRLQATKRPPGGDSTVPVGLMMVDPSARSPGAKSEHPWADADEFFASAKAAYQLDRPGLRASIRHAVSVDPGVRPLGDELLALLQAVLGNRTVRGPALPQERQTSAAAELSRITGVSNVEDSVGAYPQLRWLIEPSTRPGPRSDQP